MKSLTLTFLLTTVLFVAQMALAQTFQSLGGETGGVTIRTTPTNLGPNQFATAILESYSTDINRANISWFLNGKLEKEGVGEKTLLFKTGNLGY